MIDNPNEISVEMLTTRVLLQRGNNPLLIVPCEDFNLKRREGIPFLTLKDISNQLKIRYGEEIMVDVWTESGLSGRIYRYNNHGEEEWINHGTTEGYS